MPLYDVEHVSPLTPGEQHRLAQALTNLHANRFKTPRTFVSVRFTDASAQPVFCGGRLAKHNRMILRTRVGDRSKESYDEHCGDIVAAWREVLGVGKGDDEMGDERERELRTIWVQPTLLTGIECGIARPRVGEETEWLVKNRSEFEKLATEGDDDFVELLRDIDGEHGET